MKNTGKFYVGILTIILCGFFFSGVSHAELDVAKDLFNTANKANVYTEVYKRVNVETTAGGIEILRNLVVDVLLQYRWFILSLSVIFLMLAGTRIVVGGGEDTAKKQIKVIRDIVIGMVLLNISFFIVENIFGPIVKDASKPQTLALGVKEVDFEHIGPNFAPVVIAQKVVYPLLDFFLSFLAAFTILYLIIAAFRILTAQGAEDRIKNSLQIFLNTLIGFAVIVFAKVFVQSVFGDVLQVSTAKPIQPDLVYGISMIMSVVNYILGFFVFIAVVMYIYAGVLVFWGGIKEENRKKGIQVVYYTTMGLFAALLSYTFLYFVVKLV